MTTQVEYDLLQTLLDSLPDYIFFKDRESRFIKTNKAHAQFLLGLTDPAEAVSKTDFDLFPEKEGDAQRFYDEEQRMMETGQPIMAREWQVPSVTTGDTVWLSEHKIPMKDKTGQVIGLVGFGRDITLRKKLTLQLQTAAELGHIATGILELRELIRQSVNLISERFNLGFVGLFLVEELQTLRDPGRWAILRGAAGNEGQKMMQQGYKLSLSSDSAIGRCIATGQFYIKSNANNLILPDMRTELVLPLMSRRETIGALSVQSDQQDAFTEEDISVFQLMASQLANAIENARLFNQVETELEEVKTVLRNRIRSDWSIYLDKK